MPLELHIIRFEVENNIFAFYKKKKEFYFVTAQVKRFRFSIVFAFVIFTMYVIYTLAGVKAVDFSLSNIKEMLGLISPIFVFMGLLDSWIPKETFIKYMGENSGLK